MSGRRCVVRGAWRLALGAFCLAIGVSGCASYKWTSDVPASMRTVFVPTMRNESDVTELGAVMSRQIAREFQREGTFRLGRDEAALEVQGIVRKVTDLATGYDRRSGSRFVGHQMTAIVEISVVDKVNDRVLIDNRPYEATTTVAIAQDMLTANRDASGRLADELARQVVSDVLNLKW